MVGFNFLTGVPLDDFIEEANFKASKISERMRSRASLKVEEELTRRLKENEQRKKLDKVLKACDTFKVKN